MRYIDYYRSRCKKEKILVDPHFITWIIKVESYVYNRTGLYLLDLPDESYMSLYETKVNPISVAKMIVENFEESNRVLFSY